MSRAAKVLLLLVCETLLCGVVAAAFWYQDLRYSRPTPVPSALEQVSFGESVELPAEVARLLADAPRSVCLLHFFNPDCPCSRFNIDHVSELMRQFGEQVRFIAVLEGADAAVARAEFEKLNVKAEAVVDTDGSIAAALGVYSTPQAVVLDENRRLVFRGNYNVSRYCADPETEFVRLALQYCLSGEEPPAWPEAATVAQGCELPANIGKSRAEVLP